MVGTGILGPFRRQAALGREQDLENVAPIVKTSVASQLGPTFASTVNAVSKDLTLAAILAMNKAVEVDKANPATVAAAFLKANHLK